ncbi:MAG: hypothetical protein LUG99_10125 [Lachnospiraceae bacterium]|nr:hypothetical protein [Lachnospiraceae bacterium]
MRLLRMGLKLILLPVMCLVLMMKWIGNFCVFCSAWIFRILAMIFFLTAILSGLMGLEGWPAVWQMLIGAFIIFLIPCVGEALVAATEIASSAMITFILS